MELSRDLARTTGRRRLPAAAEGVAPDVHGGAHDGKHNGKHNGKHGGKHDGKHDGKHAGKHDGKHDADHHKMHHCPSSRMFRTSCPPQRCSVLSVGTDRYRKRGKGSSAVKPTGDLLWTQKPVKRKAV